MIMNSKNIKINIREKRMANNGMNDDVKIKTLGQLFCVLSDFPTKNWN